VNLARQARIALGDYPNAMRMRGLGFAARIPESYAAGRGRPVVLLPGVYERWNFLRPIADALAAAGHPIHIVRELGVNDRAIPASATRVLDFLARHDLRGVALVAHSKGGLIGKQVMATEDGDHRVDRLIAVATPFAGSGMARLTYGRTLRAFLPTDEVIVALAAAREHHTRLTSIYPMFDPHIPEGSRVEGATNVEIPVIGHFRILRAPGTITAVLEAVER